MLALVIVSLLLVADNKGKITGIISDEKSGEGIAFSRISLIDAANTNSDFYISDRSGRFTISELKPGAYALEVTAGGYVKKYLNEITVIGNKSSNLEISLVQAYSISQ